MSESLVTKVRALLAKAESTEFEAEAEAFYAKAAELMAEHAIDEALIRAKDDGHKLTLETVEVKRIIIPNPYSRERVAILTVVADALGGYAYFFKQKRDGTKTRYNIRNHDTTAAVVGFPEDVDTIIEIFESMMEQCERYRKAAVDAEVGMRPSMSLGDKKVFSKSFIRGFAYRIGKRMKEAYENKMSEVKDGSVALVLVKKDELLSEKIKDLGVREERTKRKQDVFGWQEGDRAGQRAQIHKEIR